MVLHPLDPDNPDPPPFMVGEGRSRIGLRLAGDDEWIHRDARYEQFMAAKLDVLATNWSDSVACLPGAEQASEELLGMIQEASGRVGDRSLDAIDAAGRLVQEDLCLLDGETFVLVAGSVCFPQGWLLSDKIGKSMRAIHDPVTYYGPMADPADRVLGAMDDRVRARTNWFVVGDDQLRVEPGAQPTGSYEVHLRFERQTLRRLPDTGAIVFTIRTYLSRLESLTGRIDLQRGLLRALVTMTRSERNYHGNREPALLARAWLENSLGQED